MPRSYAVTVAEAQAAGDGHFFLRYPASSGFWSSLAGINGQQDGHADRTLFKGFTVRPSWPP